MTHLVRPLGADRTHVECSWAFPREVAEREGFDPSYAVDFWDLTNRQDWAACESVQRGLASPYRDPGPAGARGGRRLPVRQPGGARCTPGSAGPTTPGPPWCPSPPTTRSGPSPTRSTKAPLGERARHRLAARQDRAAGPGGRPREAAVGRHRRRWRPQRAHLRGVPRPCGQAGAGAGGAGSTRRRVHAGHAVRGQGLRDQPVCVRDRAARRERHHRPPAQQARTRGLRRRPAAVGAVRGRYGVLPVDEPREDARRPARARPPGAGDRRLRRLRDVLRRHADPAAQGPSGQLGRRVAVAARARGDAPGRPDDDRRALRGVDLRRARRVRHRPAAQGRALRPGRHRHLCRAQGPGHRLGEADALPGRPPRRGPDLGVRQGRHGHGQLRDRRGRARGRRRARDRSAGRRDPARRGRPTRGRHLHRRADRRQQRRPQAGARPGARRRDAGGVRRPAARLGHHLARGQVQRRAEPAALLDRRAGPGLPGTRHGRRHRRARRRAGGLRALRHRRAGGRLRRGVLPDRARPLTCSRGQAPAEHLRPVRAVRPQRRVGRPARGGRAPVHRPDGPLRAGLRGLPDRATRCSAHPTSSRRSASPAGTSSRARCAPTRCGRTGSRRVHPSRASTSAARPPTRAGA